MFIMACKGNDFSKNTAPLMTPLIAALIGFTALYYTVRIYPYKLELAKLDKQKADQEFAIKKKEFELIRIRTNDIAIKISQALIETPDWFGRYMDEMGAAFSASIFGKRFKHFYFEKKAIAKRVIEELDKTIKYANGNTRYYLVIESGTMMFALFPEITRHLEDKISREMWKKHVTIITNNIPGAQYLMKICKENPSDDDSKMAIDCFLLPGQIDSKLVATEWNDTEYPLENLISSINHNSGQQCQNKVIGFITGHHIVRTSKGGNVTFCPVTRETIHQKIKEKIANASHKIYLIAPLMQFSLKDVDYLKEAYVAIIGYKQRCKQKENV
ncbi:MAG: Chaperone protein HtpG [Candidatus Brocadiaceae bacterium]|nr:Chaperone protein HtpG [Candidatus Brocadiaceae bacterium]